MAVYFVLVCIGFLVGRSEYRARSGTFGSFLPQITAFKYVLRLVTRPQSEFYVFAVFALLFSAITDPSVLYEVVEEGDLSTIPNSFAFHWGVNVVIAVHFLALLKRRSVPLESSNIKLLVLRVFGNAKATAFTLTRLIRFWRKFGVHFTIDDPSYAKYRFRFFQWSTLFKLAFLFFAAAMGSVAHESGSHGLVAGLFPFIAVALMMGNDWYWLRKDLPVDSREQVRARIKKLIAKPARPNGDFRDLRMVCYMNTWKMVIDEYIRHADVVLMDLREFSAERRGSSYEADFLFDTVPIERIIFLRDEKSDVEAIHELIYDRWKELREGSPNQNHPNPMIQIFVADKTEGQDVQALIDLLLLAGSSVAADQAPSKPQLVHHIIRLGSGLRLLILKKEIRVQKKPI